ncbi:hypothetical protein J6590_050191 [Homalodisca vitripennis]|nr:hypothetical protein J6590_050191 [Homalodisca vitripennis]
MAATPPEKLEHKDHQLPWSHPHNSSACAVFCFRTMCKPFKLRWMLILQCPLQLKADQSPPPVEDSIQGSKKDKPFLGCHSDQHPPTWHPFFFLPPDNSPKHKCRSEHRDTLGPLLFLCNLKKLQGVIQLKLMFHLNLGHSMDVQEQNLTNRKCRDSGLTNPARSVSFTAATRSVEPSIWKEIIINNLTERCKQDTNLMTAVKLLMVVPYLPPLKDTPSSITMFEGFQVVKDFARENKLPKEFFRVMDYVAAFWFNIVKTNNFTTYGKHTCALNFVEITQLALLAYMKPKGNVWNLTQSFQCVAKMTSAEFDRYLNGKPPVLKKNRGRRFNVRIRQNMKRLQTGNYNVKKFLEMSIIYCEEMLDIFLHPLYPTSLYDKSNYIHTEGWKIKIIDS